MHVSAHPQLQGHIELERARLAPLRTERTQAGPPAGQLSPEQVFAHRKYYAQAQDDVQSIRHCISFPELT